MVRMSNKISYSKTCWKSILTGAILRKKTRWKRWWYPFWLKPSKMMSVWWFLFLLFLVRVTLVLFFGISFGDFVIRRFGHSQVWSFASLVIRRFGHSEIWFGARLEQCGGGARRHRHDSWYCRVIDNVRIVPRVALLLTVLVPYS